MSKPDPQAQLAELLVRIDALGAENDSQAFILERAAILTLLSEELQSDDYQRFVPAIITYNKQLPRDVPGLLLEAEYQQRGQNWRAAISPLIDAAEFPETNEQLAAIDAWQVRLLEEIHAASAATSEWQGLIEYYEQLLLRAPQSDRLRLHLAAAYAQAQDVPAALGVLEETGTKGVALAEIDALRISLAPPIPPSPPTPPTPLADVPIDQLGAPIRFRRDGNSLFANASVATTPLQLLVDTGATTTALATDMLQRLGANRLNRTTEVMTAAGRITAELYELPELIIEQHHFRNQTVLALDNLPTRWDGLLGMDLIRSLNITPENL
jgi:clan AA aspartic protease (TIGR02281 family)